jgi:elongation factor 1-gamma
MLLVASHNENSTLLGDTRQDYASIVRWMSFANSEILASLGGWFNPLIGRRPFIQEEVEENKNATLQKLQIIENHLGERKYLVGERLSLADLFVVGIVAGAFKFFLDKTWREEHPAVTGWFGDVHSQPMFAETAGMPVFAEKAMPNVPPTNPGRVA